MTRRSTTTHALVRHRRPFAGAAVASALALVAALPGVACARQQVALPPSATLTKASATTAPAGTVYAPHLGRAVSTQGTHWMGDQLATWYGPGFYGHRTGCGTKLRRTTWGVAHRTLPCGSLVYLSYEGRRIAVPVVDRGPYSGANLDLSASVAHFLRVDEVGTGEVKMGVLAQPLLPTSSL